MPKYTYECESCHTKIQKFASIKDKTQVCPECEAVMHRQMPNIKAPRVNETVDKYSNKKHFGDQKEILKERKLDYYWKHEVPKMVESGVYGLDTMLEKGWVYYDEKGDLVTRTKPPEKE